MILFCYLLILFAQNHTINTNNTANYIKIKSVILPLNQYFFDISLFFSFSPQSYPRQAFTSLYMCMRKPGKSRNIRIKKNWHKKNQAKHSSLGFLYPEPHLKILKSIKGDEIENYLILFIEHCLSVI